MQVRQMSHQLVVGQPDLSHFCCYSNLGLIIPIWVCSDYRNPKRRVDVTFRKVRSDLKDLKCFKATMSGGGNGIKYKIKGLEREKNED